MESMRSCLDGQQQTLGHNLAPSGERRCARAAVAVRDRRRGPRHPRGAPAPCPERAGRAASSFPLERRSRQFPVIVTLWNSRRMDGDEALAHDLRLLLWRDSPNGGSGSG